MSNPLQIVKPALIPNFYDISLHNSYNGKLFHYDILKSA